MLAESKLIESFYRAIWQHRTCKNLHTLWSSKSPSRHPFISRYLVSLLYFPHNFTMIMHYFTIIPEVVRFGNWEVQVGQRGAGRQEKRLWLRLGILWNSQGIWIFFKEVGGKWKYGRFEALERKSPTTMSCRYKGYCTGVCTPGGIWPEIKILEWGAISSEPVQVCFRYEIYDIHPRWPERTVLPAHLAQHRVEFDRTALSSPPSLNLP